MKLFLSVLGCLFAVIAVLFYVGFSTSAGPTPADTRAKLMNQIQPGMTWTEVAGVFKPKRVAAYKSKARNGRGPEMKFDKFAERYRKIGAEEGFEYSYIPSNAYHIVVVFDPKGVCQNVTDRATVGDLLNVK